MSFQLNCDELDHLVVDYQLFDQIDGYLKQGDYYNASELWESNRRLSKRLRADITVYRKGQANGSLKDYLNSEVKFKYIAVKLFRGIEKPKLQSELLEFYFDYIKNWEYQSEYVTENIDQEDARLYQDDAYLLQCKKQYLVAKHKVHQLDRLKKYINNIESAGAGTFLSAWLEIQQDPEKSIYQQFFTENSKRLKKAIQYALEHASFFSPRLDKVSSSLGKRVEFYWEWDNKIIDLACLETQYNIGTDNNTVGKAPVIARYDVKFSVFKAHDEKFVLYEREIVKNVSATVFPAIEFEGEQLVGKKGVDLNCLPVLEVYFQVVSIDECTGQYSMIIKVSHEVDVATYQLVDNPCGYPLEGKPHNRILLTASDLRLNPEKVYAAEFNAASFNQSNVALWLDTNDKRIVPRVKHVTFMEA